MAAHMDKFTILKGFFSKYKNLNSLNLSCQHIICPAFAGMRFQTRITVVPTANWTAKSTPLAFALRATIACTFNNTQVTNSC